MKKRAIIYCRVSTKHQVEEGYSLEYQKTECKKEAERYGYDIVETYIEEGISGSNISSRDHLKEIISKIERQDKHNREFDCIICWELSRISRSIKDTRTILKLCDKKDIEIIAIKDGLTPSNKGVNRTILTTILSLVNELYIEDLKTKVPKGMETSAKQGGISESENEKVGRWQGGTVPLGYDLLPLKDKNGEYVYSTVNGKRKIRKKLYINEEEAKVVKLVFDKYLKGIGAYNIAKEFNELSMKTKKNGIYRSSTILNILKNELYAGMISWGKTTIEHDEESGKIKQHIREKPIVDMVKGEHDAIISLEEFKAVQAILNQRNKDDNQYFIDKDGYRRTKKKKQEKHLFSNILHCPTCDISMTGSLSTRRIQDTNISDKEKRKSKENKIAVKEVYYKCYNYTTGNRKQCNKANSLKEDNIIDLILEPFFLAFEIYLSYLPKMELKIKSKYSIDELDIKINNLENKLKNINRSKSLFFNHLQRNIEEENNEMIKLYENRLVELTVGREELEEKLANAKYERQNMLCFINEEVKKHENLKNIYKNGFNEKLYYDSLDTDSKRELLEIVIKKVIIERNGFKKYKIKHIEFNFENILDEIYKKLFGERLQSNNNAHESKHNIVYCDPFVDSLRMKISYEYIKNWNLPNLNNTERFNKLENYISRETITFIIMKRIQLVDLMENNNYQSLVKFITGLKNDEKWAINMAENYYKLWQDMND